MQGPGKKLSGRQRHPWHESFFTKESDLRLPSPWEIGRCFSQRCSDALRPGKVSSWRLTHMELHGAEARDLLVRRHCGWSSHAYNAKTLAGREGKSQCLQLSLIASGSLLLWYWVDNPVVYLFACIPLCSLSGLDAVHKDSWIMAWWHKNDKKRSIIDGRIGKMNGTRCEVGSKYTSLNGLPIC